MLTGQPMMKPTHFGFLVTGKTPPKATAEEIQKYQAAHIENFKRLHGLSKLMTAGPCADPEKTKRGIVILSVQDKKEIPGHFKLDPYITKGFMELQTFPIRVEFGKINTEGIDPNGIEENRIVVFTGGKSNIPKNYLVGDGAKAGLAFFATFSDSPTIRAVALFRGKDDAAIKAWVDGFSPVQLGKYKASIFGQWLSKGVL